MTEEALTLPSIPFQSVLSFWKICFKKWLTRSQKIHLGQSGLPGKHCPKSGAFLISSYHLTCNQPLHHLSPHTCPYGFTGSFKKECLTPMENSSARRLSSNLPAAKLLQPPQQLEQVSTHTTDELQSDTCYPVSSFTICRP